MSIVKKLFLICYATCGLKSVEFANRILEEAGVACLAGESFGVYGKGFIRFSFANSKEKLEKALDRIDSFVASRV